MFNIEKNIVDNLAYFDDKEPERGHRDRFISKLGSNNKKRIGIFSTYNVLKVAAVVVVLIASSYMILKTFNSLQDREDLFITRIEYADDLTQIQNYYDKLSELRILKIEEYAQNDEEALRLKNKAMKKMEKLDANLAMIEKEYVKNPQSEKLKKAIINNKKMKVDVVNNIVEQMDYAQQGYHAGSIYTNY
jgi:hypothetical protein